MQAKYFATYELLPPELENSVPDVYKWLLFDDRLIWTADALRELFGPAVCNNWKSGGPYSLRGMRPMTDTTGSKYSQHRFGRALDLKFKNATADEVRADMKANPTREAYKYIRGIEEGITWFHFDVRNSDKILFFRP